MMSLVTTKRSVTLMAIALMGGIASSCANGGLGDSLQRSLSADPRLAENAQEGTATTVPAEECDEAVLAQLPADFPAPLCYPNAALLADDGNTASSPQNAIATRWQTQDSLDQVEQFYEALLNGADWEIVLQTDGDENRELEAVKQGERVLVQLEATDDPSETIPLSDDGQEPEEQDAQALPPDGETVTQFTVEFRPLSGAIAEAPPLTPEASRLFSQIDPNSETTQGRPDSDTDAPSTSSSPPPGSPSTFTDIDEAPEELQGYIEDLATLDIVTAPRDAASGGDAPNGAENAAGNRAQPSGSAFQPNEPITRRDYAEWLFAANNVFYGDRPSRKIRSAPSSDSPAFQDVSPSADSFEAIQSLANAGLIPSPLSGEATAANFRPDASLTREALITWKVPLDRRGSLPNATVADVEQTWGFQDAASIAPTALQAVLADFQNGDNANILRAFGYTTLFQPQKAVTRAEAAAVLWHFGYQGDGISADSLMSDSP